MHYEIQKDKYNCDENRPWVIVQVNPNGNDHIFACMSRDELAGLALEIIRTLATM